MLQIKILSYGEKHDGYFEDKGNAELCIVFNSKNASYTYPALKVPILIRNNGLTSEESQERNRL